MSDKIAEIRERHSRDDIWRNTQSNEDRATLLAEVDRLRAENELQRAEIELQRTSRHREARAFEAEHNRLQAALNTARRERDEARAEVERHRAEIERLDLDLQRLSAMASNNKWLLEKLAEQRKVIERLRADRRERIAAVVMAGLAACTNTRSSAEGVARSGLEGADALIALLDKESKT